jgi:hypothetical protein
LCFPNVLCCSFAVGGGGGGIGGEGHVKNVTKLITLLLSVLQIKSSVELRFHF